MSPSVLVRFFPQLGRNYRSLHASEALTLDQTLEMLPASEEWMRSVLYRLRPHLPAKDSLDILDLGAAQGRGVAALIKLGHAGKGVEPWDDARECSKELGEHLGISMDIRPGRAEAIPFSDNSFDVVVAMSVMEHVEDVERSLREVCRVLRPGGIFWFSSASAMNPFQMEIRRFPFFGWYPDRIKVLIMRWARDKHPELVGNTAMPAMHWWTPRRAHSRLTAAGFIQVWDRWQLMAGQNTSTDPTSRAVRYVARYRFLRLMGEISVPECSFAAKKGVG